jgi:hypothetical protein
MDMRGMDYGYERDGLWMRGGWIMDARGMDYGYERDELWT